MDFQNELKEHKEKKYSFNFKNGMAFWKKLRKEFTIFLKENDFYCSNTQHSSCISYREKEGDTSNCFCEVNIDSYKNYDDFRSDISLEICEKAEYYLDLIHESQDDLGFEIIEEFKDGAWIVYPAFEEQSEEYYKLLGVS